MAPGSPNIVIACEGDTLIERSYEKKLMGDEKYKTHDL